MSDASVAGTYACVTKSPMGDQNGTFTVVVDGATFTGAVSGPMGSMDVYEGVVNGNQLTWKMDMKVPMPMTLEGDVTVTGDALSGSVKAGAFGSMAMTGTRAG